MLACKRSFPARMQVFSKAVEACLSALAKKLFAFFRSMRFAVILLLLLAAACALGSFIPQNEASAFYRLRYGDFWGGALLVFKLDRLFSSAWFALMAGALCVSLILCSLVRFPGILSEYRKGFSLKRRLELSDAAMESPLGQDGAERFFRALRLRAAGTLTRSGLEASYARRGRIGVWGAWLVHVGILLVIAGFAAGRLTGLETYAYGVPGTVQHIEGTGFILSIDKFEAPLREDGTVEQYLASLTVRHPDTGKSVTGVSMVNHPMDAFGLRLYQDSTGWACEAAVFEGTTLLRQKTLYVGEAITVAEPPLTLVFNAFYPDYALDAGGPKTRSPRLDNPAALFSLYYGDRLVDMNVAGIGYGIAVDEYRFVLSEPRQYTLIKAVRDPATGVVAAGGLLMIAGLFLAFYVRPREAWVLRTQEGVTAYGRCARGDALFREAFLSAAAQTKGERYDAGL